jgi:serine beta-lactamase-like protein LACTB
MREALILALVLALAPQSSATDLDKAAIDGVVAAYMKKHEIPGLTLAIGVDGSIAYAKAYGVADLENSVPMKNTTMLRTASMGKSMTATAAMKLVEERKLMLDEPVQAYCPGFPLKQWPLTTRHLLSHLGGIRHYGGPHDKEEQSSTIHFPNITASLAPFKDDPLKFEPGTDFNYSTYGYDVVGCVIEGAARMSYDEAMHHYVFDPAGMRATRQDDPAPIIANRAAGYISIDGSLRNATHVDMSNRMAAGGYLTTASELVAFAAAFIDCKLVTCGTRDLMLTEAKFKNGDSVNYGIGWAIGEDANGKLDGTASHGGSSPGASGIMYIVPAKRLAVVFMTNLEDLKERPETVKAIAAIVRK